MSASDASSQPPDTASLQRADQIGVRNYNGETWVNGERVDADVIRVKRLAALLVEANEIRCSNVIRSQGAPVVKDIEPWRIEGDVVEVDRLNAHTVTARLIIADTIHAVVVRRLAKPYHWQGGGSSTPVRNRVTVIKELMPSFEKPVF